MRWLSPLSSLRPAARSGHTPPRAVPRRGAVAVELAVVAPVLLVLVIGSIEFGRAMMASNLLTTAAREGARVAALPNKDSNDVRDAVVNELSAAAIPVNRTSDIEILVNGAAKDASTAISGDLVQVTVTVAYQNVTWLPTTWFISTTTSMRGRAVMRRE